MSEWMGRGTQSTPCVCGVSSAICVCVWVGLGAGERREATSVDSVGGGCGGQAPSTAPHQRACHHSAPLCPVPPPKPHTQRTGRGSAHSGGGWWERRTVVVAATPHTQPPPPRAHHPVCVCVNREWTAPAQPVSGPSGHTRHNTHAATTTSTTTSSSSKRRSGVVWGTRSGWTCEWRARRGHSQHRGHTHTPGTKVHQPPRVCVCGVVVWLGCVCV